MLIVQKYILNKILKTFAMVFVFVLMFFLMINFSNLSSSFESYGVSVATIFLMSLMSMPMVVFQVISYILFISLFISMQSLYGYSELIVIKSLGIRKRTLYRPIYLYTVISVLIFVLLSFIYPVLTRMSIKMKISIKANQLVSTLKPNVINSNIKIGDSINDVFFQKINKNGSFGDMTIINKGQGEYRTIYAKKARIALNNENLPILVLEHNKMFSSNLDTLDTNIQLSDRTELLIENLFDIQSSAKKIDKKNIARIMSNIRLVRDFALRDSNQFIRSELLLRILKMVDILVLILFSGLIFVSRRTPRVDTPKKTVYTMLFFAYIVIYEIFVFDNLVDMVPWFVIFLHAPIPLILLALKRNKRFFLKICHHKSLIK